MSECPIFLALSSHCLLALLIHLAIKEISTWLSVTVNVQGVLEDREMTHNPLM